MDRRLEYRSCTQDAVRITFGDIATRGAMQNLSTTGCMVQCPDILPDIGSTVELALLPGYVARGEVGWQVGESIGIVFLEPIHEGVVRHYALDDWVLKGDKSVITIHPRQE